MSNIDRLLYVFVFATMVFVMLYFVNMYLPYWSFQLKKHTVIGSVIDSQQKAKHLHIITYSFLPVKTEKKRIREIESRNALPVGTKLVVKYAEKYPNYVEVEEITQSPYLIQTIVPVVLPLIVLYWLILILLGKAKPDNY